ncbi:MAG: dynamin family protein [Clostridiales bacterium]|nr:dynamin family protein [Clostridiales bacterium]
MENIYSNYHAMSAEIAEGLSQMAKICDELDMTTQAKDLKESRTKLQEHKFAVGILGEFKRGKSTVINALLGNEIMPADILPCSATMNRVSYGIHPSAQLNMVDGTSKTIAVEDLTKYVTKLDEDSMARATKIEEAIVFYPCQFCQNGVEIVDTPGLNDDERMDKITQDIIPKLDAVIMVLIPDSPFSMSEAEFVRNKLMVSDIGRLIFLINKIDLVRERDREKVVKSIREKIESTVLDRTHDVYGENSEQYAMVKAKLADIRIYPISATQALDGRLDNDEALLAKSGVPEFESALSRMLTEERGALELSAPLTKAITTGNMIGENIKLAKNSMEVDEKTFKETQRKAMQEVKEIKKKEMADKAQLEKRSKEVEVELGAQVEQCYAEIEEEAAKIIDNMQAPDPKKKMSKEEQETLVLQTTDEIQRKICDIMSIHAERMSAQLNQILQDEGRKIAETLAENEINLQKHFDGINIKRQNANPLDNSIGSVAIDVATTYVPLLLGSTLPVWGVGGLIEGYKAAGIKGAAVGGGTAFALSFAAFAALPALGIVGLPMAAIGAVAGTFGGKAIVKTLFKKDIVSKQISELKKVLNEEVSKSITQMRVAKEIEKWIQDEVKEQFEILIKAMEKDCDNAICETERKLNDISNIIKENEAERNNKKHQLDKLDKETGEILTRLLPIYQQIAQA